MMRSQSRPRFSATSSSSTEIASFTNNNCRLDDLVRGGQAELLLSVKNPCLASYLELEQHYNTTTSISNSKENQQQHHQQQQHHHQQQQQLLLQLANTCRRNYLSTGMAHIPQFLRREVVQQMVHEAIQLRQNPQTCFFSTESHTVYQEPQDLTNYPDQHHPRNVLQQSSKYIIDYARLNPSTSPLVTLYTSPHLKAFVSYIVRPLDDNDNNKEANNNNNDNHDLFYSACPYNAAYYNIYEFNQGLGWHFDKSDFGVNLELSPSDKGGIFELCYNTRHDTDDMASSFAKVQHILEVSDTHQSPVAQRIHEPSIVQPGSLVIFAGARNLHRVTPVMSSSKPRINAIMTFETKPLQKPNAYSLEKFFGR
jgi:hypothetical protein